VLSLVFVRHVRGQDRPLIDLDKVYRDETHCLEGPETRSAADKRISCYCRDALADAQYVYRTYLITHKDRNLNGTYLRLAESAQQECGNEFDDVHDATMGVWKWNGPEVTRIYPPDSSIEQIKPDSNGFRTVTYQVRLTYREARFQGAKVETFSAVERLPPDFKGSCPPSAICPK